MPELPTPEVRRFLTALEDFLENPPRDLPEGAVDTLGELRQTLKGYNADEASPGEKEVVKAAGRGTDEGLPYNQGGGSQADPPSPGQQEVQRAQQQAKELANTLGGLGGTDNA